MASWDGFLNCFKTEWKFKSISAELLRKSCEYSVLKMKIIIVKELNFLAFTLRSYKIEKFKIIKPGKEGKKFAKHIIIFHIATVFR